MGSLASLVLIIGTMFLAIPQSVGAQSQPTTDPFCYGGVGTHAVEEDCGGYASMIEIATGSPPAEGFCYVLGFPIRGIAYDDAECVEARGEASVSLPEPRCYEFAGDISVYNGASYISSALSEGDCDDIRSHFGYDFSPGYCYVVGDDNRTSSSPCTEHDTLSQVALEKEREIPTDCNENNLNTSNCQIINRLAQVIRLLSAVVGIVVVIMIVWGGIQYTSARDNPQQAAQAKDHIRNAVFALIFYIFSVAILNYLIPGGLF